MIRKKNYLYRRKGCIENFCKKLKELGTEINNYEKKRMTPLTDEEIKFYERQKVCCICTEGFCTKKMIKINLTETKLEIIVITQENLEEQRIVIAI